ncbi:MAG: prolyl-tRNA synthetase associated domain-containing protein [Aquisalinus sp.]|nr:prolyl-tRNA synthetase associated domain-containing protein [Aquisalinus sp.]
MTLGRPATRTELFAFLDDLGLRYETRDHYAVFTVEESKAIKQDMPGGHSKNLFLKDKAGTLSLVVAVADTQVDLKALGKVIGAKQRLSFGKPDLMMEVLGVIPGAVTPFALINDGEKRISNVIFDDCFASFDRAWFHPLENTASTAISFEDVLNFVRACGHAPVQMNLSAPGSA